MERHDEVNPDLAAAGSPSEATRRGFLGGVGAIGLAAIAGAFSPASVQGAETGSSAPIRLSSIQNLTITRNETFEIPGGKEYFLEQRVSDDKGVVQKMLAHHTRVDSGVSYMMSTDVTIQVYGPGMNLDGSPASTNHQSVTVSAIKGEVSGSTRTDHMTVTTVYADGSTSRKSVEVPVRLDTEEFSGMTVQEIAQYIGEKFVR